jgi:hypothetical protein
MSLDQPRLTQGGGKARGARLALPWAILWCPFGADDLEVETLNSTARMNKRRRPSTFALLNDPEKYGYSLT